MNQWGYNEEWMFSQRDPRWGAKRLGKSNATMAGFGCVVTGTAYILSRFTKHEVGPGNWVDWCNRRNLFTPDGRFYWSAMTLYTKGAMTASKWNPIGAKYTGMWVKFAGQDHFVVKLRNPKTGKMELIFDPWDGKVKSIKTYPDTGRRVYFKA